MMWKRLTLAALAVTGLAACDAPVAAPDAPPSAAPRAAVARGPVEIEVKFREELGIRVDDAGVRSTRGRDVAAVRAGLSRAGAREVRALVQAPAGRLEALERAARERSPRAAVPDLGSWHRVALAPGTDPEGALAVLRALPEVEHAYVAPEPAPPPTPDYTAQQTYFGSAPAGTEAVYARSLAGGKGAGVKVVDLEYDWHFAHEDLGFPSTILITGSQYTAYGSHHGTAVLGELAGKDNGFGVTGGVPDATIRVASPIYNGSYLPAQAITNAAAQMAAGDVLLIEQQIGGPNGQYVPLEWIVSVYDAIRLATQAGIIVVEAAGNGGQNLDDAAFNGRFNRSLYDSGAIIVGAGNASHARLSFSCYGSRLDVQGLGTGVTTTGYGGLYGTTLANYYTSGFNGTSSASPIVAAAAASIQGHLKATSRPVRTPAQMRALLASTGSPQTGTTSQKIGPYPNLNAAIAAL